MVCLLGDTWKEDDCTTCTCNQKGRVTCQTKECVVEKCQLGQTATVIEALPGQCCPTVLCTASQLRLECPETTTPECAEDQQVQYQEVGGCLRGVCECLPPSQCPTVEQPVPLVGEEYVLSRRGCCPQWTRVCHAEQCPTPVECPAFYERSVVAGSTVSGCCPEYQCLPPSDACVYEHLHLTRKTAFVFRRYDINATWSDGPCKECRCVADTQSSPAGAPRTRCVQQTCPTIVDEDYALALTVDPLQCCPTLVRSACKQADREYQVPIRRRPFSSLLLFRLVFVGSSKTGVFCIVL